MCSNYNSVYDMSSFLSSFHLHGLFVCLVCHCCSHFLIAISKIGHQGLFSLRTISPQPFILILIILNVCVSLVSISLFSFFHRIQFHRIRRAPSHFLIEPIISSFDMRHFSCKYEEESLNVVNKLV